jgi:hypothetical protein
MKPEEENEKARHKFAYYVDGDKYESVEQTVTGAIIKSRLPEAKRGYALWEEGREGKADRLINDDTTITFEQPTDDRSPKRFFTVPPATFGRE